LGSRAVPQQSFERCFLLQGKRERRSGSKHDSWCSRWREFLKYYLRQDTRLDTLNGSASPYPMKPDEFVDG
jgi:hypothetical protein